MQRISGTTKLAGVIGKPLAHTLSPAMHNAVYGALRLDWVYVPFEVADEIGLRRFVAAVRSLPFVGFNVTMPYKQAVIELVDEVAKAAHMAGAVNAVHCVDGRLVGYNTDGRGLMEALETEASFVPAGRDVVLLGAGGAAAAALVSLILGKPSSITLVNRNVERAEELMERMTPYLGAVRVDVRPLSTAEESVREADLVINATPVGMGADDPSPVPIAWLGPGQVVFDMVYGRAVPTALVSGARAQGAVALDGLGMLVGQGAIAVDIWSSSAQTRTPRPVMREAAEKALAERASAAGRTE